MLGAAARLPGKEGVAWSEEKRYPVLIEVTNIVPAVVGGQSGGNAEPFPDRHCHVHPTALEPKAAEPRDGVGPLTGKCHTQVDCHLRPRNLAIRSLAPR